MLSRESFGRHQECVGPLIEQFRKSRLQLFKSSRPYGVKQDVRLIGGDFGFPDTLSHTRI